MGYDIRAPKEFFFRILTLDITPEEAILELIDTFIEWYMYYNNRGRITHKAIINIQLSKNQFVIESNYPGPPKKMALHLFRFGERAEKGYSRIGAYGIGTKRALFKLGQDIFLESDDANESFSVYLDKNWFFDKENWEIDLKEKESEGKLFNKIKISDFYNNIANELRTSSFEQELRKRVRDTYIYFIREYDLDIRINGKIIKPLKLTFLYMQNIVEPYFKKLYEDRILVEILAGITKRENKIYGWYVFCNDRLVMRNDLSNKTGFDFESNIFHPFMLNNFLGIIFFRSILFCFNGDRYNDCKKYLKEGEIARELRVLFPKGLLPKENVRLIKENDMWKIKEDDKTLYEIEDSGEQLTISSDPIKLPWKSSKDVIREDARIYRMAQTYMKHITSKFLKYFDELYRKMKEDGIDCIESLVESEKIEDKDIDKILEECKEYYEKDEIFGLIDKEKRDEILRGIKPLTLVQFSVPLQVVKDVKKRLGNVNTSDEEMGKKLLDYYIKMEGVE